MMKTMYDVQQLLKKHGTIIYTGDRALDLALMEEELRELHEWNIIERTLYIAGLRILRNEMSTVRE